MNQEPPSAPAADVPSLWRVDPNMKLQVRGRVQPGDRRGRTIGFPTANLPLLQQPGIDAGTFSQLQDGVWVAIVQIDPEHGGPEHIAAVSVGRRPTFYGRNGERLLEAHLLDFSGDLYGRTISVKMLARLRRHRGFRGTSQLVTRLERDVRMAREWIQDITARQPELVVS